MGYYNNYGGYNRGGAYRGNYSGGYSNSFGNSSSRPRKKRSGCKIVMKDDAPILSGWKLQGRELVKMYARPYKGTHVTTSKSGKTWLNLFVTLTIGYNKQNCNGLFCVETRKMYIKDLNLVASPSAPNGGYFGKHISKR